MCISPSRFSFLGYLLSVGPFWCELSDIRSVFRFPSDNAWQLSELGVSLCLYFSLFTCLEVLSISNHSKWKWGRPVGKSHSIVKTTAVQKIHLCQFWGGWLSQNCGLYYMTPPMTEKRLSSDYDLWSAVLTMDLVFCQHFSLRSLQPDALSVLHATSTQ